MSWFGKSLVVLNTAVSLIVLGAITWMVVEQRQFADDYKKRQEEIDKQRERWDHVRGIFADLLVERQQGKRTIAWEVDSQDKKLVVKESISVADARERVRILEQGRFPNMPSIAELTKQLNELDRQGALARDELDKAQKETQALGGRLAKVAEHARQLLPAPGKPDPVETSQQMQQDLETKIRGYEFPLSVARQNNAVLLNRQAQLTDRLRELRSHQQPPR